MIAEGSHRYFECWLHDSSRIRFKERDVLAITPDSGTGLFYVRSTGESLFKEKVLPQSIKEIQVSRISFVKTSLLITPLLLITVAAAAVGSAQSALSQIKLPPMRPWLWY